MEAETDADDGAVVQRAFVGWLRERQPNFAVQIVGIRPTAAGLEFAFEGWPGLECTVTDQELTVAAFKDAHC